MSSSRPSALGIATETLFDDLVKAVPPGALGLMLQPYWNPGIKLPGPEAKGAVIGFGEAHTRAHLYRAILEGLAYALREGRERIERRGGSRIERVRVAGGGSQSDAAMQITADVFNLPAERPHLYETSGLGAAMIAAVGLGPASRLRHRRARNDPRRPDLHSRPDPRAHLRRALPQGVLPHVPAAAAALPRDTRDHRVSGAALGRGGDQRRDVQRGGQAQCRETGC
jgi:sugar (pentulose or hexulose) kinase